MLGNSCGMKTASVGKERRRFTDSHTAGVPTIGAHFTWTQTQTRKRKTKNLAGKTDIEQGTEGQRQTEKESTRAGLKGD